MIGDVKVEEIRKEEDILEVRETRRKCRGRKRNEKRKRGEIDERRKKKKIIRKV